QYAYDSEGNLIQTTDAQNNITTIAYDILGRKTSMTDPDMGVWSYQYDLNGNLTKQTDAKGQVIDFAYDTLNRLINKTDHAGMDVDYTYDDASTPNSKGRLSYVQYGTGIEQTAFAYDELGREISSSKTIGTTAYDVLRSYDALNRVTDIEYPDGENVFYAYNFAGQIEQVANDSSLIDTEDPWTVEPGSLFLRAEGADGSTAFADFTPYPKVVTAGGNAQIDTAQFKFGSSSILFDGSGDYLTVPGHSDFEFGSGNFTIDLWVKFNSVSSHSPLLDRFGITTNAVRTFNLWYLASHYLAFEYHNGTTVIDAFFPWTPSANTWYHVSVVRDGSNLYAFVNDLLIGSPHNIGTQSIQAAPSTTLWIGAYEGGAGQDYDMNGWMDDIKIVKGAAVLPEGFMPP
ncbi:MAG: hypothetical protein COW13_01205, partial [Candidatus Omnitrophica bacterium CG12_big_fil_rev_8_21_14_0_65_50_5]